MEKMNLESILTENINEKTKNIDASSTLEMLTLINNEDASIAFAVKNELENISCAVDGIYERVKNGGRLIYIGAGTSGRLGVLDASECPPTYGVDENVVIGIIAGGNVALTKSVENAEDNTDLAIEDLKKINFSINDALVGIAASGRTPYVLSALEYANDLGAYSVAIACSKNSPMGKIAQTAIEIATGPEVITGSTRMKAGSAQKMVLNMISTSLMIKLGKVYDNLMVDVKPLNKKLIERSKKIFMEITKSTYDDAETFLRGADYNLKIAIVMKKTGLSMLEAKDLLLKNNNILKKVIS